MPSCKLTKRIIDALPSPSGADQIWWDEDLKGFGLKLTPAGRKGCGRTTAGDRQGSAGGIDAAPRLLGSIARRA